MSKNRKKLKKRNPMAKLLSSSMLRSTGNIGVQIS